MKTTKKTYWVVKRDSGQYVCAFYSIGIGNDIRIDITDVFGDAKAFDSEKEAEECANLIHWEVKKIEVTEE